MYPSKSEAEYTAPLAFAIAVAASWWAARTGRAHLHVPRMPASCCVGRREHWLELDPRSLREWAMTPLAITLGLEPLQENGSIPSDCVYVGLGHHSHRLPTTCWKSPWVPGHTCAHDEWLSLYVEHIRRSDLWDQLPTLQGKRLVCDCPWQDLCEADMLAGLCFDASGSEPMARPWKGVTQRPQDKGGTRMVTLGATLGQARAAPIPSTVPRRSQEAVVLQFCKLFPASWFEAFRFPMVEDLVNTPPFGVYEEWLQSRGAEWEGALTPLLPTRSIRQRLRTGEARQQGAFNHKAALPPLLPFDLTVDEHFEQARLIGLQQLPTEKPSILDPDLLFAADMCGVQRASLRSVRTAFLGVLKELHRRWAPVTLHLRHLQPHGIRCTTHARDLGFTALLIVLSSWPDIAYPFGLIRGLPAVGFAPCYGIFPELDVTPISMDEVLGDWQGHNAAILHALRPGIHDEFTLTQSCADADKGFCSYPLSHSELLSELKGRAYRLIPRCVITQSSGKQRVIDDAHRGGQSETSRDSNKLILCSPLRPAQHAQALVRNLSPESLQRAKQEDSLESGGEDWPDAYRHSPMSPDEAVLCIVVWWHPDWQAPAYQVYHGLLFGLPLAVTSFNRYSRLVEALGRRLLFVLVSMYFDDAHITDWASSRGSGQSSFRQLNILLGTPFADDKCQPMQSHGIFLGLEHDLSEALSSGCVYFWTKPKLVAKLHSMMMTAQADRQLSSGQASKIYGLANFFEQGIFGRVGNGGLHAIKARQYERDSSLNEDIHQCFQVLQAVIAAKPRRQFPILDVPHPRFCAASDAALEEPRQGSGGFLITWFQGTYEFREAFIALIPDSLYDQWTPGDRKIAQLELVQVLYALIARPAEFRGRRGVWFIDNLAALMALIRGRSDSPDLERLSHLIHLACFALRIWIYWEYIPSKSNWADSISRLGAQDPWHQSNGFTLYRAFFPIVIWHLPFPAVVTVFEML